MAEQPYAGMTVMAARAAFFTRNGMPAGGGYMADRWSFRLGGMRVTLANSAWRRRAIALHDLHHILTGFPCTAVGECEMAAWEFAAGPYPDRRASLFCLPLVGLGALMSPRRTFAAFVLGRQSRTLYSLTETRDLSAATIDSLRAEFLPARLRPALSQDRRAYRWLVMRSILALVLPIVPLVAITLTFCLRG